MLAQVLTAFPLVMLAIVAVIHAVFAYKEVFDWEASAVKSIGMSPDDARASAPVGKNQGLYNGFLAAGAAWSLIEWWFRGPSAGRPLSTFFCACALAAGLFGSAVFQRNGFLTKQALPGAAGLIAAWLPVLMGIK
jgi:putative membrane protein